MQVADVSLRMLHLAFRTFMGESEDRLLGLIIGRLALRTRWGDFVAGEHPSEPWERRSQNLPSKHPRIVQDTYKNATTGSVANMAELTNVGNIFRNLMGTWKLRRTLNSSLPGFPSGTFEGTATFVPRKPTAHSIAAELLYHEEGELKTDNGFTLKANRKYIYRYSQEEDKMSAWFVKEDTKDKRGKEEVDYLFHDVEMTDENAAVAGRGEHLCSMDMYWAYYEFRMPKVAEDAADAEDDEPGMNIWGLRYKVKGPEKDYTSDTAYERA
jgi:hypothetical protein